MAPGSPGRGAAAGFFAVSRSERAHLGRRLCEGIRRRLLRRPACAGKARRSHRKGLRRSATALRAFIDIGGAGALADAFTIWVVQWVDGEIRILDYYESVGQVLAFHVGWLRSRGYQHALLYLPHDGV